MKKIISLVIVAAIAICTYAYFQQREYSAKLKKVRDFAAIRKLNVELAAALGNPVPLRTDQLICDESGSLVVRVSEESDKSFWEDKSSELLNKTLKNWSELAELEKKTKKTKSDERRIEDINATISADNRIRDAINIGLIKPFWVSAESARTDYTKSCLGR